MNTCFHRSFLIVTRGGRATSALKSLNHEGNAQIAIGISRFDFGVVCIQSISSTISGRDSQMY